MKYDNWYNLTYYFNFQSEIMDMKEEMMNDAIDDVMGDEEDDEER